VRVRAQAAAEHGPRPAAAPLLPVGQAALRRAPAPAALPGRRRPAPPPLLPAPARRPGRARAPQAARRHRAGYPLACPLFGQPMFCQNRNREIKHSTTETDKKQQHFRLFFGFRKAYFI